LEAVVQFSGFQGVARMFDAALLTGFGINGVTWFVSVILCFYLLFPLIARPYFRHPLIGLALAALISIAWKEAIAHTGIFHSIQTNDAFFTTPFAIDQFPGFAFSFGAGMTAAWAYHRLTTARGRPELERWALWLSPLALLGLGAAVYLFGHRAAHIPGSFSPTFVRGSSSISIAWSAAVAFAMLVVLLGPEWMRRPFESRPARRLGDLSYGIFLIQAVFIIYLADLFPAWVTSTAALDVTLLFLAVLGGSILYAMASRRLVERPVAEWAARHERRREAGPPSAGTSQSAARETQPTAL
jgi:peptidoglycan/LPS O-acetylase OafA/YrhL